MQSFTGEGDVSMQMLQNLRERNMVQIIFTNMYVTKHSFAKRFVKNSNDMLLSSHTYMSCPRDCPDAYYGQRIMLNSCDFEGDSTDTKRELVFEK